LAVGLLASACYAIQAQPRRSCGSGGVEDLISRKFAVAANAMTHSAARTRDGPLIEPGARFFSRVPA